MILLTGHGAIAAEFLKKYPCEVISIRTMTDDEIVNKFTVSSVVIHNAALINSSSLEELIKSNFLLTKRILDLIEANNLSCKFVNISSMSFLLTEDKEQPLNQMSNYALSKYLSEQYCLNHSFSNVCSVRFSTLFYQDPNRDGISKIISDAFYNKTVTVFNNGVDSRDVIPIEVAVDYLYKICQDSESKKIYNVVCGSPNKFSDIINKIKKYLIFDVVNVDCESKKVLSSFSTKYINSLGIINFDIEDYIYNYIKSLNASSSL